MKIDCPGCVKRRMLWKARQVRDLDTLVSELASHAQSGLLPSDISALVFSLKSEAKLKSESIRLEIDKVNETYLQS